ncbi:uncharacterized protein ColSpa_03644 [Colletotrichum spaethianum]|uniref:Uncharacterized protein n=1 Tax=Colletotrichum spaethianum TaxID=700344 RepID=A0AA37P0F3_9PEZI|nr:uncharacterized protein ColSpa_03644 [Colletotrichum spaethianum]GKT43463.1 hypothetical protein ColSpa_03644 [Colletotrichum spaethianum]
MASDTQTSICLDVAVDHRIRRLFKPVPKNATEPSTHVSRIEEVGRSLQRPRAEIQVTAQLAGPPVKGGIAIMLQKPRSNHPFGKGLDAVINDCETLRALDDIFAVVSRGTLDFRKDIAVVDLLPYVSEDHNDVDDARLKDAFRTSAATICDKEPKVLLCAGKIMMPFGRAKVKGISYTFENIGVGEKFGRTRKWPEIARVRHEGNRGFIDLLKVNGFHPSYAMNYHSHVSLLRQLLILIGAEACGAYRKDWEDRLWMDELRERCQAYTSRTEYQQLYSEALIDIRNCVSHLISTNQRYETLLDSGLSEKCNNASLILRQMLRLKERGWPESVAWKNEAALKEAAQDTYRFAIDTYRLVKAPTKSAKPLSDPPLAKALRQNLDHIVDCVTVVQPRKECDLDVGGAATALLELAVDIETLLLDLLDRREIALLSGLLSKVSLAPVALDSVAPVAVGASRV